MPELTPNGQKIVNDLATRHGFSAEAVTQMLIAVIHGNGGMAQFSHPEFGGSGQWMRGGMSMIGDMFNNTLKARVDSLCEDLANLVSQQPGLLGTGSFQSQNQSSGAAKSSSQPLGLSSLFVPDPRAQWYPAELGSPSSSGSQNDTRYAYFASAHRLAVDTGGEVWVYDTLNHQIGGFSQQQGGSGSITFSSQFGTVLLTDLPVVMRNGKAVTEHAPHMVAAVTEHAPAPQIVATASGVTQSQLSKNDIFSAIEKLADLKTKGILTEAEFSSKKTELLDRL